MAGSSGFGAGGAAGESNLDTCPELPDPQDACPEIAPTGGDTCIGGTVCDYDTCENGCNSTYFCPAPGGGWTGMAAICGGECYPLEVEQSPWEMTRNILFAEREGACGALGSLA